MPGVRVHAVAGLLVLAIAALGLNLPRLAPGTLNWAEPGNVAAALAEGRGFSDPFAGGTGATAWVPPLPVWIDAAVFSLAGVKTPAAAKILLGLAVLGLAATHALLGTALAPGGAWLRGVASGLFLAGAVALPNGPLVVKSEAWLNLLLGVALLAAALAHRRRPGRRATVGLIVIAGLAPLANAGLAFATAVVLLTLAWRDWRGRSWRAAPYLAAFAATLTLGAWTARNAVVLGRVVPLKSNFWFELHLTNVAAPDGIARGEVVLREMPFFSIAAFERYARLGEIAYVETFRAPAIAALKADPAHFAANVARRASRALVYCFVDEGNAPTQAKFSPADMLKLIQAGELLPLGGIDRSLWTRLETPPAVAQARFAALGLADFRTVWADWAEKRLAYDAARLSPARLFVGFITAGAPILALLAAALAGGGRLSREAAWAALITAALIAPFVLVNHNPRQQFTLLALQAVVFGACAQAWVDRRRAPAPPMP